MTLHACKDTIHDMTNPSRKQTAAQRLARMVAHDPHRSISEYAAKLGVSAGRVHQLLREMGYRYKRTWVRNVN